MTEAPVHDFSDGDEYEAFMGRWSRAVADPFLEWLRPPAAAAWLDIGCGTGAFTERVLKVTAPSTVVAIDPSRAQVSSAQQRVNPAGVWFQVADAQALPFADGTFDIVAAALVLNFVANPANAVGEMCRVARPDGIVAGFVWDFGPERSPSGPLRTAMQALAIPVPPIPGTPLSAIDALTELFRAAGLRAVAARNIEIVCVYPTFADFWRSQTPGYSPTSKVIAGLAPARRKALIEAVKQRLPVSSDGTIRYGACANAVKGWRSSELSADLLPK